MEQSQAHIKQNFESKGRSHMRAQSFQINQGLFNSSESPIPSNIVDNAPFISPRQQQIIQAVDSEKLKQEQKIGEKYVDFALNGKDLSQNVIRLADLKSIKYSSQNPQFFQAHNPNGNVEKNDGSQDLFKLQQQFAQINGVQQHRNAHNHLFQSHLRSMSMQTDESRSLGSILREEIELQQKRDSECNRQLEEIKEWAVDEERKEWQSNQGQNPKRESGSGSGNEQSSLIFERSHIHEEQPASELPRSATKNKIQGSIIQNGQLDDSLFDFSCEEMFEIGELQRLEETTRDSLDFLSRHSQRVNLSDFEKASCEHCQITNEFLQIHTQKLAQITFDLKQSHQSFKISLKQKLQIKSVKYKLVNQEVKKKLDDIESLEEKLRVKEEDLNTEVQTLLQTIDDHKKVNDKLNKHYQKRFKLIEADLTSLQKFVLDQNSALVSLNVLGSASRERSPLVSQRKSNFAQLGQACGDFTSRNQFAEVNNLKNINSHRGVSFPYNQGKQINSNRAPNFSQIYLKLQEMLCNLRKQMELKVRLKDPLDDNGAHLIPSSRIQTNRYGANIQQTGRTLIPCKSSARLDQAFVQNTSRSNLNFNSTRRNGWTAGNMNFSSNVMNFNLNSRREILNKQPSNPQGLEQLCETCLSNEYSMYSIEEEHLQQNKLNQSWNNVPKNEALKMLKQNQNDTLDQKGKTLLKEYLGGKEMNELSLSERDKLLTKILMKDFERKQLPDAQHVKWQDILNYQKPPKVQKEELKAKLDNIESQENLLSSEESKEVRQVESNPSIPMRSSLNPIQYVEKSESQASQAILAIDSKKSSENYNKYIHDLSAIPVLKSPDQQIGENTSLKDDMEDISLITGCEGNNFKSFDNSFSLVDNLVIHSQKSSQCGHHQPIQAQSQLLSNDNQKKKQLQQLKVPALNLDKIKNQQTEFFKNNIKDKESTLNQRPIKPSMPQLEASQKLENLKNIVLNENSSFLSNDFNIRENNATNTDEEEKVDLIKNQCDKTLNLDESSINFQDQLEIRDQVEKELCFQYQNQTTNQKHFHQKNILSFGDSLVFSPIVVNQSDDLNSNKVIFTNNFTDETQKQRKEAGHSNSKPSQQSNDFSHYPTPMIQHSNGQSGDAFQQNEIRKSVHIQSLKQNLEQQFMNQANPTKKQVATKLIDKMKTTVNDYQNDDILVKTVKRSRQISNALVQDSSTNQLIQNLDELFQGRPEGADSEFSGALKPRGRSGGSEKSNELNEGIQRINVSGGQGRSSSEKKKIIIKRGSIQKPEQTSSQKTKQSNLSPSGNNFTLGPQKVNTNCSLISSSLIPSSNNTTSQKMNQQEGTLNFSSSLSLKKQNYVVSREGQNIHSQTDQYLKEGSESAEAYSSHGGSSQGAAVVVSHGRGKRAIQSAKNRPVISKQITQLFSQSSGDQSSVNSQHQKQQNLIKNKNEAQGIQKITLVHKVAQPYQPPRQEHKNDISSDLIQLTEYLSLTNQSKKVPPSLSGQQGSNQNQFAQKNIVFNPKSLQHPHLVQQQQNITLLNQKVTVLNQSNVNNSQYSNKDQVSVSYARQQPQKLKPNNSFKLQSLNVTAEPKLEPDQEKAQNAKSVAPRLNISKLKLKQIKMVSNNRQFNQQADLPISAVGGENLQCNQTVVQKLDRSKLDQSSVILTQPVLLKRPIIKINKAQIINRTAINASDQSLISNQASNNHSQPNATKNHISNLQSLNISNFLNQTSNQGNALIPSNYASAPPVQQNQEDQGAKPQLSHRYLMRRVSKIAQQQQQLQGLGAGRQGALEITQMSIQSQNSGGIQTRNGIRNGNQQSSQHQTHHGIQSSYNMLSQSQLINHISASGSKAQTPQSKNGQSLNFQFAPAQGQPPIGLYNQNIGTHQQLNKSPVNPSYNTSNILNQTQGFNLTQALAVKSNAAQNQHHLGYTGNHLNLSQYASFNASLGNGNLGPQLLNASSVSNNSVKSTGFNSQNQQIINKARLKIYQNRNRAALQNKQAALLFQQSYEDIMIKDEADPLLEMNQTLVSHNNVNPSSQNSGSKGSSSHRLSQTQNLFNNLILAATPREPQYQQVILSSLNSPKTAMFGLQGPALGGTAVNGHALTFYNQQQQLIEAASPKSFKPSNSSAVQLNSTERRRNSQKQVAEKGINSARSTASRGVAADKVQSARGQNLTQKSARANLNNQSAQTKQSTNQTQHQKVIQKATSVKQSNYSTHGRAEHHVKKGGQASARSQSSQVNSARYQQANPQTRYNTVKRSHI